MNVKKELFKAKVKTFILMRKDNADWGYDVESPYLYPISDLENIVIQLAGISEEEDETLSNEAIDWADEICHILDIEEKKDEQ